MAYFDEVKVGDKVWSFEYGWGVVKKIHKNKYFGNDIEVYFKNIGTSLFFDLNDIRASAKDGANQTLFWDEIKFDTPKKIN